MKPIRSHITLGFSTLAHAFTHAYQVAMAPMYVIMARDLGVAGEKGAQWVTLIMTVMLLVIATMSYGAGILADRFNRKNLMGLGVMGNGLMFVLMGYTHRYDLMLLLGASAGMFWALFHPMANALVPAHYPKKIGLAVGILGAGSGIGYFFGAQYSGWRSDILSAAGVAMPWQRPLMELGIAGVVFGLIIILFGSEVPHARAVRKHVPMGRRLRNLVLLLGPVLGVRDFAGVATMTLMSLYLQKAWGYNSRGAGFVLGAMMLVATVANPIGVSLSQGKRRLPALAISMGICGLMLAFIPVLPVAWIVAYMTVFQSIHLSSYSIGEAALVERVDADRRGRVIGLYLTVVFLTAAGAPWAMGFWVDNMGERALHPSGYVIPFIMLGAMMAFSALSVKIIGAIGKAEKNSGVEGGIPEGEML